MSPTGAEPSSPSCLAAARAVRRRARPEVREWRVEHVQERPALPQTSCDQQRKHRHAEQEPRSQLAEVRAPSPSMTPPIAGRTVPRCEAAASFAAYTNASISRSARRSSAPNSLPGRHDERAEHPPSCSPPARASDRCRPECCVLSTSGHHRRPARRHLRRRAQRGLRRLATADCRDGLRARADLVRPAP
jgi:hypothetical protein